MTPVPRSCQAQTLARLSAICTRHHRTSCLCETHSKVLEQARTQIEPSIRTTWTSILDDRLGRLASIRNGNRLSTFRRRVTSSKLSAVERDSPCAVLVQVPTGSESDRGIVVGHTDPRVTFLILVSCGDGERQGGGGEGEEGDEGGSERHHVVCGGYRMLTS
jgi:hypothetical protein